MWCNLLSDERKVTTVLQLPRVQVTATVYGASARFTAVLCLRSGIKSGEPLQTEHADQESINVVELELDLPQQWFSTGLAATEIK